jgi:hypothetical protein
MLQKACKENIPFVGPEGGSPSIVARYLCSIMTGDPEGWYMLPSVTVTGTLFGAKSGNVDFNVRRSPVLRFARF